MPEQEPRGALLLIGGAEDKAGSRIILRRFVELAGGSAARIAVIATASAFQELVGRRYLSLFAALGVAAVELIRIDERADAQQAAPQAQLADATGIFLTGGDQLKLTAILGGTRVGEVLGRRHREGCVIGGTSAGASAVAEHMLAYGAPGMPPRKAMMQFAPGLGLIGGVVVDQHFGARIRAGRLITAIAHNPALLGIGLDENTAAEINAAGQLTVYGSGAVTIIDGAELSYSDIHHIAEHAPLTVFGLRMHVLADRYHFDLHSRIPYRPTAAAPHPEVGYLFGEGI
ncbi:MAG TPA: cyanophycinase [Roseiflexaceae bacterium]|nr:cyanophycinase [Roseiflexaceae bacterium]HMP38763.1 cyanophycinase [Roseiflexaceae bacterium]